MWKIIEHRDVEKVFLKLPPAVQRKYELWQEIVGTNGPNKLRELPGFRDEKLKGERFGERSSRLSLHYRVIYSVANDIVTVYVLEITPHKY